LACKIVAQYDITLLANNSHDVPWIKRIAATEQHTLGFSSICFMLKAQMRDICISTFAMLSIFES